MSARGDTSASIFTAGLLGEQYIALEPGGALENLVPGDRIQLTQSALVLEQIIGQFLYSTGSQGSEAPEPSEPSDMLEIQARPVTGAVVAEEIPAEEISAGEVTGE